MFYKRYLRNKNNDYKINNNKRKFQYRNILQKYIRLLNLVKLVKTL